MSAPGHECRRPAPRVPLGSAVAARAPGRKRRARGPLLSAPASRGWAGFPRPEPHASAADRDAQEPEEGKPTGARTGSGVGELTACQPIHGAQSMGAHVGVARPQALGQWVAQAAYP